MTLDDLRTFAVTMLLGIAGAAAAIALAFPAPYLIGPAIVLTFGGLAGLRLGVPEPIRNVCFLIIGVSMGTSVTPEVIVAARTWPLSFVMVIVTMVILLYSSSFVLQRFFGYDRTTALLASSPGHLSYVLSLAAETRCHLPTVSIAQSVRVLALTITVPLIVEILELAPTGVFVVTQTMSTPVVVAMLAVSALVGIAFRRWKLPAAILLGGVAVSISTHVTGWIAGGMPDWLLVPTYVILGCVIGSRFCGVSLDDLRRAIVAGLTVTVIVTAIAAGVAAGISYFLGVPLDAALIAFSPGGLETMAAMAVMLNANPTYVGAHHVLRLMVLSVLMPLALGRKARQL
jgi:uncharacterized protein